MLTDEALIAEIGTFAGAYINQQNKIMQVSIETIHELRIEAINNIKRYCEASGENFTDVKNAIYQEADPFNLKLPTDFYIQVYNLSLTLKVN